MADLGCSLSALGSERVAGTLAALSGGSGGKLSPTSYPLNVQFTGIGRAPLCTEGMCWPVQFGSVQGTIKTAIIPGRSPILFSKTALTSMEALTDHLNAKLWFPRAQAWIPLRRGPENHFFLRLFDFVSGGLIQDIPPVPNLARRDLDLEGDHETCPALSGSVPERAPERFSMCSDSNAEDEHTEQLLAADTEIRSLYENSYEKANLRADAVQTLTHACRSLTMIARKTRGPTVSRELYEMVSQICCALDQSPELYTIVSVNLGRAPKSLRNCPDREASRRLSLVRDPCGSIFAVEPICPYLRGSVAVPVLPNRERPALLLTIFLRLTSTYSYHWRYRRAVFSRAAFEGTRQTSQVV